MSTRTEHEVDSPVLRTNDMGMAAYFTMNGHSVQEVTWDGETCYWIFIQLPSIVELADVWAGGRAMVEPRQYNKFYADIRRTFFETKERARS